MWSPTNLGTHHCSQFILRAKSPQTFSVSKLYHRCVDAMPQVRQDASQLTQFLDLSHRFSITKNQSSTKLLACSLLPISRLPQPHCLATSSCPAMIGMSWTWWGYLKSRYPSRATPSLSDGSVSPPCTTQTCQLRLKIGQGSSLTSHILFSGLRRPFAPHT